MITKHLFKHGALRRATAALGALLAMSAAAFAADPSTFPAPTGDTSFVPTGAGKVDGSDRKSTRLNSSHQIISHAVVCFKKKNIFAEIIMRLGICFHTT